MRVVGEIIGANPVKLLQEVAEPLIHRAGQKVTRILAAGYAGDVRQTIIGQELIDQWEPLSPRYLAWKVRMGLDTRTLRATGEYVQSIQVRRSQGDDGEVMYVVSPAPDRSHQDPRVARPDGPTLKQVGFWLEYGTFKVVKLPSGDVAARAIMPARPHWRPVWIRFRDELEERTREVRDRVWAEIKPYLDQDLREALQRVGTVEIIP